MADENTAGDTTSQQHEAEPTTRRRPSQRAASRAPADGAEGAAAEGDTKPAAAKGSTAKGAAPKSSTAKGAAPKSSTAKGAAAKSSTAKGGAEPGTDAGKEAGGKGTSGTRGRRSSAKPETAEAAGTESAPARPDSGPARLGTTAVLFQAPEPAAPRRRAEAPAGPPQTPAATDEGGEGGESTTPRRRRRRGGRGRGGGGGGNAPDQQQDAPEQAGGEESSAPEASESSGSEEGATTSSSSRRRRRRRRPRSEGGATRTNDEVTGLKGSTRLEAKRQRRREGRDAGRRRTIITEAEFLARRESVERSMVVREAGGRVQIAILEDGVLVEHYVSRPVQNMQAPMVGNVYLGRVQNVLPSMEAAFVDIGKGRNAVLYAGEVNWDAAGLEGQPRRIEQALKSGDSVLVQVTKEPVGHKGARLTSQITLAGRYLVYVPGGGMTGISRKLPDTERARLKKLLREIVTEDAGVIVRTAAEGASDEDLSRDVVRLQEQWAAIEKKAKSAQPPTLLQGEPDLATRVVRDVFNDDFVSLVVQGEQVWSTISEYLGAMAPDLTQKLSRWEGDDDVFAANRIDEQLAKGMDRKVWLPSGGSLIIDRTEAMTVIDVNTGRFTGSGGTLEETVTRNNLEAAEEIVRQLRLRDIGGIIVVDFIDMVLESNRDLVLRRLVECLGRDRTRHQVAEVSSLGLVQMTRKRIGQGLLEAFSETCPHCGGRGFLVHSEPVDSKSAAEGEESRRRAREVPVLPEAREAVKATLATIAAAAAHAHEHADDGGAAPAGAPDEQPPETLAALDAAPVGESAADAPEDDVVDRTPPGEV